MTPGAFRELFPALTHMAWVDTPACAPGAVPVIAALTSAITSYFNNDDDVAAALTALRG